MDVPLPTVPVQGEGTRKGSEIRSEFLGVIAAFPKVHNIFLKFCAMCFRSICSAYPGDDRVGLRSTLTGFQGKAIHISGVFRLVFRAGFGNFLSNNHFGCLGRELGAHGSPESFRGRS